MDNMGLSVFHLNLNVKYRITSDMKNSCFANEAYVFSLIVYIIRCIRIRFN